MRTTQKILLVFIPFMIASLFFMTGGYFWFQAGFVSSFLIGNYYSLKDIFVMVFKTKYIIIKECFEEVEQTSIYGFVKQNPDGTYRQIRITRNMILSVEKNKFEREQWHKKLETLQFRDSDRMSDTIIPIAIGYIDMVIEVRKRRKGLGENWSVYSITKEDYLFSNGVYNNK